MFSRSVYVIARRYEGFIRCRQKYKNIFLVPVVGKARFILPLVYFADFIKERLDGFLHRFFTWWRTRKNHYIYRLFKRAVMHTYVPDGSATFDLFSSNSLLYYMNTQELC